MKYVFNGNTKFVIVEGKAYPVKEEKGKKFVEIPDNVEVKEKFLKPEKKPKLEPKKVEQTKEGEK
ncbi:hypothetical protein [Thermosipho sp. 1074]|uniref:hypothetical protein n=1 Tax=Thermosipho sp. 1074 TaxID=1643331 RepID=UPI00098579D0|nr:hypothetical protein [Thermosipho sp. 1074]OOC42187.1 hypothetical protein XO08_07850 [Thermosipho sp. 1074]